MKEKKETEYLARDSVVDSPAYQREMVVCVVCMRKKRNTLIAEIELVCFPARQQFNIKRSVSACVWMADYIRYTHTAAKVSRYCVYLLRFILLLLEYCKYILYM